MRKGFVKNQRVVGKILRQARVALLVAATELREDLVTSETMPIESGHLQNTATIVVSSDLNSGIVNIVNDAAYARRKYFNPDFAFNQNVNRLAGGRWFEPYLEGSKRNLIRDIFAANLPVQ